MSLIRNVDATIVSPIPLPVDAGLLNPHPVTAGNLLNPHPVAVTNLQDPHPVRIERPLDPFGRVSTATPATVFDSKFEYDAQPLLWELGSSGGGASFRASNAPFLTIAAGNALNDSGYAQTYQYHYYQPGRGQVFRASYHFAHPGAVNVTCRIGLFDAKDGVYFRQKTQVDQAFVVRRTLPSAGATVETVIPRAAWNLDPLDGTGPSGIVFDHSSVQILCIDAQWLGVGSVFFGFDIGGKFVLCHRHDVSNEYATTLWTSTYTRTFTLPVRVEVVNEIGDPAGATAGAKLFCASVVSSGGDHDPHGFELSARNTSFRTCPVGGLPILSVRPRATFGALPEVNRSMIFPEGWSAAGDSVGAAVVDVVYGGVVTGGAWANVNASNSALEFNITGTAITGGIVVDSGFITGTGSTRGMVSEDISGRYPVALNAAGVNIDRGYTLVGYGLGGNRDLAGAFQWREVR